MFASARLHCSRYMQRVGVDVGMCVVPSKELAQRHTGDKERTFLNHLADKDFAEAGDNLGDGLGNLLAEGLLDYLTLIAW